MTEPDLNTALHMAYRIAALAPAKLDQVIYYPETCKFVTIYNICNQPHRFFIDHDDEWSIINTLRVALAELERGLSLDCR